MSNCQRRDFLLGAATLAAAGTALITNTNNIEAGDLTFLNNVPDPLLGGKELPTFKFALEKSEGKVIGGSSIKMATVAQLPISKGISGVSIQLEPGGLRDLHWHAMAAEWAFVIDGHVRTSVVDPQGNSDINDFGPGDIWFFPRGHGHMLECLGDKPAHFILIFDNGYFAELGSFSITDWIGHTPKSILAKNFGLPESAFEGFPKEELFFTRGAIPPATAGVPLQGRKLPPLSHKFELLTQQPHAVFKGGREWLVDSSRFPIAKTIAGVILDLEPGALRELHWHPNADEWQYVIAGNVSVNLFGSLGRYRIETLEKGDVAYIPQAYGHSIENIGTTTARLLIGFNTGSYEAINLSQWIAGNSVDVLATNFGKPAELFNKFPKKDFFIADKNGAS